MNFISRRVKVGRRLYDFLLEINKKKLDNWIYCKEFIVSLERIYIDDDLSINSRQSNWHSRLLVTGKKQDHFLAMGMS